HDLAGGIHVEDRVALLAVHPRVESVGWDVTPAPAARARHGNHGAAPKGSRSAESRAGVVGRLGVEPRGQSRPARVVAEMEAVGPLVPAVPAILAGGSGDCETLPRPALVLSRGAPADSLPSAVAVPRRVGNPCAHGNSCPCCAGGRRPPSLVDFFP